MKAIVDRIIREDGGRFRNFDAAAFPLAPREAPLDILRRLPGAFLTIAEVKKGSPSRGVIRKDYDPVRIARSYEAAGASAVSVITEKNFFFGDPGDLSRVKSAIGLPVLRKDFIVHECQIYESYNRGADLVLLIAACLEPGELNRLHRIADSLGMRVLVEIRDEWELERAVEAGPRIVGINNRDLKTFEVDWTRSLRLRPLVPPEICLISESGIHSHDQIQALREAGFSGVLIGGHLMKQDDPGRALRDLIHGQS